MHDHRGLLQALAVLLRPTRTTATLWDLPPLSARLLGDTEFLVRLVEQNPSAGVKPVKPVVLTIEEEDKILNDHGWRRQETNAGRFYWYRNGTKESSWHKPRIPKPSQAQLEEQVLLHGLESLNFTPSPQALVKAEPKELLLVSIALQSSDLSQAVILALIDGIQQSFSGIPTFRMRVQVWHLPMSA